MSSTPHAVWRNLFSASHISAGFIAVLVGYTSSAAIVFQAAEAAGANSAQIASWLWALGVGTALTSISLSLRYKTPVLTAWSTPGAALLITSLEGVTMNQAVGIFLFSSSLILVCGLSGVFEYLMRFIPSSLAAGMLAGVLLQFGLNIFSVFESQPLLVGSMLASYILGKRYLPRFVIPITFMVALIVAFFSGGLSFTALPWAITTPVWITPALDIASLVSVGLPLFIVTMASQNVPGVAVIRANKYTVPISPLISSTGLTGILLAPFGGFAFNLAAITAAICMGEDAGKDKNTRYFAAVWAGIFYLTTGLFGATIAALFMALPEALVIAIAGLALLGIIGNSLVEVTAEKSQLDAALITFMVTASGISVFGIGSAFWGLLLGGLCYRLSKH